MELHVVRAQGQLLKQLVRYAVMPSGNTEFYGATGILEFKPGEREVVVALVARPDGIPEVRYGIGNVDPPSLHNIHLQNAKLFQILFE